MYKWIALCLMAVLVLSCIGAGAETASPAGYTYLGSRVIPAPLDQRVLSDQQIRSLVDASKEEIKAQISTFADYVAWVEALGTYYYGIVTCDDRGTIRLDSDFNMEWIHSGLGSSMVADLGFQFLQDDYPGMKIVMTVSYSHRGNSFVAFSNAFPVEGGYIILGAESFAANGINSDSGPATHTPIFVEDLSGVISYAKGRDVIWGRGSALAQVMIIHSDDPIDFKVKGMLYVPDNPTSVEVLYEDKSVLPGAPALADYGIVLPGQPAPAVADRDSAVAILEGTVEEAAKKINTIQDFMNYVYYAGYDCGDGDLFIPLRGNAEWHFNYKPHVVFERNTGCCGATAGLIAYLLEGDYEEVGIVGITYSEGCGGGHVINYVRHSGMYYVFDVFGWGQSGFQEQGLQMCINESLTEACLQWARHTGEVECMYSYTNPALGDAPVGWNTDVFRVSRLIKDYAQNVRIHLENPQKGYVYEFVEVAPEVLQAIEMVRSIW